MGIALYDEDQVAFGDGGVFRGIVNGHIGGAHEERFYVRNDDVSRWFTNVSVSLTTSLYDGAGESGSSGISFKFIYGERRPTEAEWDIVASGDTMIMPDIGTSLAADTSTYHPVWVRIYVPGNTPASIIDTYTILLTYFTRIVGL